MSRSRWQRLPLLPLLVLSPTLLLTAAARSYPVVFESLRRDPVAVGKGELWRLLTPVLVQADALREHGWWRASAVFVLVAAALALGQRAFGPWRMLLLYLIGAYVGHAVGHVWQPYSAGCSVAGCGVLGGIAGWLLRAKPPGVRFGSLLLLVLGGVASLLGDIHGPPLLVGALAGMRFSSAVPLPVGWTRDEPSAATRR